MELIKKHSFKHPGRLLLGAVLPDSGFQGNSHFKVPVAGGHKRTYDFEGFRERFGELMERDELYLVYYLHGGDCGIGDPRIAYELVL